MTEMNTSDRICTSNTFPNEHQLGVGEPGGSFGEVFDQIGHECLRKMSRNEKEALQKGGPMTKARPIFSVSSFFAMSQSPQGFEALVLAVRLVMAKWAVGYRLSCDG